MPPPVKARPGFSVVIPHYNNVAQTLRLIAQLSESELARTGDVDIVVVDDASPDGSGSELASKQAELGFRLFVNPLNLGFGNTVNRGAALADGEILIVANTDIGFSAQCPADRILSGLAEALRRNEISATMPLIYNTSLGEVENVNELWANRGLLWLRRKPCGEEKASPAAETEMVETILCGAFFAMRRIDFLTLGGFDPVFSPFFWEDVELGERIRKRGGMVALLPHLSVLHHHNKSIGPAAGEKRKWYVMRSNQLVFTRMHGHELGVSSMSLWCLLRAVRCFGRGEFGLGLEYLGIKERAR